ncbi:DUF3108 domain-containing protein [Verrucomicrobiota bacterium]
MKLWIFIFGLFVAAGPACAEPDVALPFRVGESLEYRIHWGVVNVGYSRITTEWVELEGRKLIAIRLRSRTNAVLSKLYPVDDFVESLVDPVTFRPVRFIKKIKQGGYHCDEETHFDYEKGIASWISKNGDADKQYVIDEESRDILTFLYYARLDEFQPGTVVQRKLISDEKQYDLDIHCEQIEEVELDGYGKIECLKMEPKASFQGIFVRKGRMWMWVSRDPRRICTEIKSKVFVGKVSLTLCSVTGPGDDFWVTTPTSCSIDKQPRKRRPPFRRR